jgi:hypothetical protein
MAMLWMAALSARSAQAAPLLLDPHASVQANGHLWMLRDPHGSLGADEAAATAGWQPLGGAVNAGYTTDTLWLRLDVRRPAEGPGQWLVQFSNALLDDVRLYRQDASGHWQLAQHAGRTSAAGTGRWTRATCNCR